MSEELVLHYYNKLRAKGHRIARAYRHYDRDKVDSLIVMGVINAIQRLDPSKTDYPEGYITWWVRKMINEDLRDKHTQATIEIHIPPEHRQHVEDIFSEQERNIPVRFSKPESRNLAHLLSVMGFQGYIPSRPVTLSEAPRNELILKVTICTYHQDDLLLFDEDEDQQIPDEPEEIVIPTSDDVTDLVADLFFSLEEIEQQVVGHLAGVMKYQKLKRNELAKMLGKDKKTIKSIYERALSKMQSMLALRAAEYSRLQ